MQITCLSHSPAGRRGRGQRRGSRRVAGCAGADRAALPFRVVKARPLPILISVAGACLIGLLVYGVSTQSASRTLDTSVHEGRRPTAPDASRTLPMLGGPGVGSLSAQRGKVVLLNFWASWCVPCEAEAPLLQRNEAKLKRDGATVLGVTYLDASPDSEAFVRRYHLSYPNLRDNDNGDFAHAYGTDQLPESFIVDRRGHIVAIARGEIEQQFIDKALRLAETT
jgi:cytochrome c biogenesis protein CcmG, thiol:disulfide interchange protein DsbE